jgi:hypothetical protein
MTLRPHRRNLVVWSQSADPASRPGAWRLTPTRRIRRWMRIGALLSLVGLLRLGRAMLARWRPLLVGGVLTAAGLVLRGGPGAVVLLPGLMTLMSTPLYPGRPQAARTGHSKLERELAAYSTPAQRRDLAATLDQYPDDITDELRDILAGQAMAAYDNRFPSIGRY